MRSSQRIRQTLRKYQRKPVTQQGILGNEIGEIAVPNRIDYVYVRVAGLGTISIYNKRVPLILDLPVDVGYDPLEPKNFQVLNIHRYPQGGGRGLVDVSTILHGKSHNWAGIDPVYIEKRQLMPLRPTPLGGMQVYVTREVTYYDDKAVAVTGQQLDLSPYVPATGSLMVLLYKDTDELIKIRTGSVLKDLTTLSLSDAPPAYPGTVPIALIRLYGGQSGIAEGYQDTDLIDVRQLFSPIDLTGTSSGGVVTGGHNIMDEGATLPHRAALNFIGSSVWAVDNAGQNRTDIIISGTSSGISTGTTTTIIGEDRNYVGAPFVQTLSTGGYGGAAANQMPYRYDAAISTELNGVTYQVVNWWDDSDHLMLGVRVYGGAFTYYLMDGAGGRPDIAISAADAHYVSVAGIDPDGYIHIVYDEKGTHLHYRKSTNPVSSFDGTFSAELDMLGGTVEDTVIIPGFINDPSGKLYFYFKSVVSQAVDVLGDIYFYKYDEVAGTWAVLAGTTAGKVVDGLTDSQGEYWHRAYFDPDFGSGGFLHFAWVWQVDQTDLDGRHNLSYLRWDGTNWTKSDGSAATIPTREANADIADATAIHNGIWGHGAVVADASHRPHIVYSKVESGVRNLYVASYLNGSWTISQVTADHNIISCPSAVIDRETGEVIVIYTDSTAGNGIWVSKSTNYTTWAVHNIWSESVGALYTWYPKFDPWQWEHHKRLSILVEYYSGIDVPQPIYLVDILLSDWALWNHTHPVSDVASVLTNNGDLLYNVNNGLVGNQALISLGASATAIKSYTTYTPDQAIDGSAVGYWYSYDANVVGSWIKIDLGSVKNIGSWRLKHEPNTLTDNSTARSYRIESSIDDLTYNVVVDHTTGNCDEIVSFPADSNARYFKFTALTCNGNGIWGWAVETIELYPSTITSVLTRLPIGSTGTVLTSVNGLPAWVAPAGGTVITGAHTIMDEGTTLPYQPVLNFIGTSLWAVNNAGQGRTDIIVSGTSSGGGHIIEDEGTPLTQRTNLNFVGASVNVTDDPGNDATVVTISNITGSSSGDVSQYGAVTAGHIAIFHADKSIEDGGVLTTGSSGTPSTLDIFAGVVLYDNTLGSAGTWDVSNLAQTYDHLKVIVVGRSAAAVGVAWVHVYVNNDKTATNYRTFYMFYTAWSATEADDSWCGVVPGTTAGANLAGVIIIDIPFYRSGFNKQLLSRSNARASTTEYMVDGRIEWENNAAISRIYMDANGQNFDTGSRIQIIGYKALTVVTGIT